MVTRSNLKHTSLDNSLADLFGADWKNTVEVLAGRIGRKDDPTTHKALEDWPATRQNVANNVARIASEYDPLADNRILWTKTLPGEVVGWLTQYNREWVVAWLGLSAWRGEVEIALANFDSALRCAQQDPMLFPASASGPMPSAPPPSIVQLGNLLNELMRLYSGRRFFNFSG